MGRIGITYQEVAEAVSELQGKQKHPTVDNVRDILGTGSKSTIARFLREWKANHGLNSDDDGSVPSELSAIVKGLWERLKNKAETQVTEYRQDTDTKVAQMQQQLNQFRQSQANLQSKIHVLEEQLHHQTESNQRLTSELIIKQQEQTKMTERATSLESRRQESQTENERLHQLLKHMQENLEHYQTATQQLRQEQLLQIEKQRNESDQQLSQLRSQLELLTVEKSNYQAQCTQLNKNAAELVSEKKTLNLQNIEMQQQYTVLKLSFDKIEKEYEQLSKTHQQQSINLENKHHAVIELQLKVQSSDEKIALLESDLSMANNKIHTLRHEHQFTLQEKANIEGQLKQLQSSLKSKTVVLV